MGMASTSPHAWRPSPRAAASASPPSFTTPSKASSPWSSIFLASPSIAVLPFVNMSGDHAHDYLSDGITENIITGLSRFRDLSVIASQSTFAYKGKALKIQDVASELGVRFVLEGSVQKSSDRITITAQLIDAITGANLWAERFDRGVEDITIVLDEVTEIIVAR